MEIILLIVFFYALGGAATFPYYHSFVTHVEKRPMKFKGEATVVSAFWFIIALGAVFYLLKKLIRGD